MSEGRGDKSTSRSRSLGVMEGKGFYSKHTKPKCRPRRRRQKAPLPEVRPQLRSQFNATAGVQLGSRG
jgi:hypothetical protein